MTKRQKQDKPRRPLTANELAQQLTVQRRFLQNSCRLYDEGEELEAIRLATTLRILCYSHGKQTGLLSRLRMLDTLFVDTAEDVVRANEADTFGLVIATASRGRAVYVPRALLKEVRKRWLIPFEYWWSKTVICVPGQFDASRHDLVCWMANQDGGAHVDPGLTSQYYELTRVPSHRHTMLIGETVQPISHVATASMRQMAGEVLEGLAKPIKLIPSDLAASEAPEIDMVFRDPVSGKESIRRALLPFDCPCHSGLLYGECHKKGGRNCGKVTPPIVT